MLVGIIGAMDLEVQALKGLMDNAVLLRLRESAR